VILLSKGHYICFTKQNHMKKLVVFFFTFLLSAYGFAQDDQQYIRPSSLGFSFVLYDFVTPQRIQASSLSTVLREKQTARFNEMGAGIALSYFKGLRNKLDFAGTFMAASADYTLPNTFGTVSADLLLQADASLQFKMVPDRYFFSPYLSAGVGANKYGSYFGAFVPLGVGFKFNFFEEATLFVNAKYHIPVTGETMRGHFVYGFGIGGIVGEKRAATKTVPLPQAPQDSDSDGIANDVDQCPDIAGVAKYNGCPVPDTDKDGIDDEADSCVTVAGVARYNGCPVPDSDKDGINDEDDKCKEVAGVAKYAGCPVPDSDGDGVNDEEDKCPQLPGTAANQGCPEIKEEVRKQVAYNAARVYFVTGSSKLSSKSNKALDDVVKILGSDANFKLSIEGHTDNVGKDEYNQTLSEARAASVKEYLVKKGIDESRLTAQGFGETQPIADNNSAAGKAKNRRVVMKVSYF
jgi:OOP family OmpA-OmpF porin